MHITALLRDMHRFLGESGCEGGFYMTDLRQLFDSKTLLLLLLTEALSVLWPGPSGGGFLASARKSIRSSLKGALTAVCSRTRAAPLENPPGALLRQRSNVSAAFYRGIQNIYLNPTTN